MTSDGPTDEIKYFPNMVLLLILKGNGQIEGYQTMRA